MKIRLIVAGVATALLATTSISVAQVSQERGGANAPAASPASPNGPSTSGAPSGRMGQGAQNEPGSGRTGGAMGADDKAAPRVGEGTSQERTTQSAPSNRTGAGGTQAQSPSSAPSGSQAQTPASSPDRAQAQSPSTQSGERNAAGTSSQTNVNVNLSADQRTRIRQTVVRESNAPRLSRNEVNFNISVGTVIPRSVHVAVLPAAVIEIHPVWRGYSYILVGDDIVILEPGSLRIVAIIPA